MGSGLQRRRTEARRGGTRVAAGLLPVAAGLLLGACGGNGSDPIDPGPQQAAIQTTVTLDGAPASGVEIRLFGSSGGAALAVQETGSDGTTTFTALDPGTYEVEVEVPEGAELDPATPRRSVTATGGTTAAVTFALATAGGADVVTIMVTGSLSFNPADVTIEPGQTVVWRNAVSMLHTITPQGHSEWSEGTVTNADDTFTHTFQAEGTFPYECTLHAGMTGVVRVQ
jgi:plastocyanin